jgi:hypothetical protein
MGEGVSDPFSKKIFKAIFIPSIFEKGMSHQFESFSP